MYVLALILSATIWGTAFVAQSLGMDYLSPFSFNSIRFFIGGIVLIPVVFVFELIEKKTKKPVIDDEYIANRSRRRKTTVIGGMCCGVWLTIAVMLQQIGILYTSVGKAGFLTTLYIILVPILQVFFKKRVRPIVWIGAILALSGMYIMCITEDFTIGLGDAIEICGGLIWAFHVLTIDHFVPKANAVAMSSIQFLTTGVLCGIGAIIFERDAISIKAVLDCAGPILYTGVLSSGVAYTLQVVAQKKVEPTVACLLMSLESVASAIAAWLVLGQKMTANEIVGCAIVFIAVILVQLPTKGTQVGNNA